MARGIDRNDRKPHIALQWELQNAGAMTAINAIATVSQNNELAEGVMVSFFWGANPLPQTDDTNEYGRALSTYEVPKGTALVHLMAQIDGTSMQITRIIRLEKEAKPISTKKRIVPTTFRAEGNADIGLARYWISTFVFYENGEPATGAVFEFSASLPSTPAPRDTAEERSRRMVAVDEQGYCAYIVEFNEIECDVTISGPLTIEGKEFQQEIKNLQGPLRHLPPLKWEPPSKLAQRLGFGAIMGWTFERIRAHKEKRASQHAHHGVITRKPPFIEIWIATMLSRIICALSTNNNYRLLVVWLFVGAWALVNIFVIGTGPAFKPQYANLSDVAIRVVKRVRPELLQNMDSWSGYRFWLWGLWPLGFLGAVLYIPRALGDEWERAKSRAWRTIFEQRGKLPEVISAIAAEATNTGATVHQKQHEKTLRTGSEVWKFIGAVIREIMASSIAIAFTH